MDNNKEIIEMINILEAKDYKYFCKAVYEKGMLYETPDHFKFNCLKIQIKKDYEKEVMTWFNDISMTEISKDKYYKVFNLNNNYYLVIEYVIDSHIIIPKLILKDFKSSDARLYYIESKTNEIKPGSARKFNTKFGYYSLRFEEFLSKNYETNIGKIKKQIERVFFDNSNFEECNISIDDLQKFLDSVLLRNPEFVFKVNQEALSSKLIYKGYNTEFLMKFQNDNVKHVFENFIIYLLINRTDNGLVLSAEFFSNIYIKKDKAGIIVPLHPKYGIVIIPHNNHLPFSNDHYLVIEDKNVLYQINKKIYTDCRKNGINVIGIKEDLMNLL